VPLSIEPDKAYTATVYLNRFLRFREPGAFSVNFECWVMVQDRAPSGLGVSGSGKVIHHEQQLRITLKEAEDDALRAELRRRAAALKASMRADQRAAVRALCAFDTPLAIPFLLQALSVPEMQVAVLRRLGEFDEDDAIAALRRLLKRSDPEVVTAALRALDRQEATVENRDLVPLLSSSSATIRYEVLDYLRSHKRPVGSPTMDSLLKDANPRIRAMARRYLREKSRWKKE
jgi:hypothetical protein